MTFRQTTIGQCVSSEGVGLHTGAKVNMRLCPAPPYTGIVFRRVDLDGFEIRATPEYVAHVSYATALVRSGVLVATVEHLLAAFYGSGIDNVFVDLDGFEVPILDGSAALFVQLIESAGVVRLDAPQQFLRILKCIDVADDGKFISICPGPDLSIHCSIDFNHPLIGRQEREVESIRENFSREIAPARTFGFHHEVDSLRRMGLIQGGSLENAIVLTDAGMLNQEALRFPDEFVRHKILDLIGDLTLLGRPVLGHVEAARAGHGLHNALVKKLLRDPQAWQIIEATEENCRAECQPTSSASG